MRQRNEGLRYRRIVSAGAVIMDESRILGITDILSSGACLEYDVPPKLRDGVAAYLERRDAGEDDAAKPRLSSTVMLLRDKASGASGFQVFMQQRASTMAFVPDAVVFPGGSFDPVDDAHDIPWEGPNVSEWASLMGCDEETARRALVTAAREVFEETGGAACPKGGRSRFRRPHEKPGASASQGSALRACAFVRADARGYRGCAVD